MKKLVCWLLLIALAVSLSPVVLAEGESAPPASWAAADVEEAEALGMVPEGLQSDWQSDLTRGEFAELVVRFLAVQYGYGAGTGFQMEDFWQEDFLNLHARPDGQPFVKEDYYPELAQTPDRFIRWDYLLGEYAHFFDDVEPANRADYIGLAYLLGIVEGRGDGTYDPDGIITRQEAAALLARAYQVYAELETPQTAAEPFSDSAGIAPWAQESVSAMQGWGVLQGDENGVLRPDGHYTREQGVVTLMRLYRNMPVSRYNGTLAPLLSYADVVERCKQSGPGGGAVAYEAETEICTILYVTYGGVMHPPAPAIFLIYPDSTYKRIELVGYVEDGFQLNEDETKLMFSAGIPRVLDLRTGILETDYDKWLEREKRAGTVEGFYHRPFDELPQALRDTLIWDGEVEAPQGYAFRLRRYVGPNIVITTTEVEDEALRAFLESQSLLPEEERECDPGDVWEEYEREKDREWLYSVTITDDSYATLLGLKVGDTVEEAEALGYHIDPEQLSGLGYAPCGDTWDHHLNVYVENGVVTRLDLNWGIGRYTGKYWDLVIPPTAQTRDDAAV